MARIQHLVNSIHSVFGAFLLRDRRRVTIFGLRGVGTFVCRGTPAIRDIESRDVSRNTAILHSTDQMTISRFRDISVGQAGPGAMGGIRVVNSRWQHVVSTWKERATV